MKKILSLFLSIIFLFFIETSYSQEITLEIQGKTLPSETIGKIVGDAVDKGVSKSEYALAYIIFHILSLFKKVKNYSVDMISYTKIIGEKAIINAKEKTVALDKWAEKTVHA